MSNGLKTLMVFVDGLGLGEKDPATNPIYSGACPTLQRLLSEHAVPLDACMGIAGLPQSATGQASLLTGCNGAAVMGRHVEGLPGPQLKSLVQKKNLFTRLVDRGYKTTFANAYFTTDVEEVKQRRHQSVTTVATLAAFGAVRDTAMLLENKAVYQDLTREFIVPRGYTGPMVSPRESGEHLLAIAAEHDFTLFEYFQTDLIAHKGERSDVERVLLQLDEFLDVVVRFPEEPGRLLLLTSDHGNIEDQSTRLHTKNPVPLVALGEGAERLKQEVKSLTDVVPSLMSLYPPRA